MHPHWLFVNWPTGVRFQVVRGTGSPLSIVGFMAPYVSFEPHADEIWRIDEASKSSSEADERLRRILLDNVSMPLALDEDRRADGDTIRVQIARYGGDPVLGGALEDCVGASAALVDLHRFVDGGRLVVEKVDGAPLVTGLKAVRVAPVILGGMALLLKAKTSLVWRMQAGDVFCDQEAAEGVLIPLGVTRGSERVLSGLVSRATLQGATRGLSSEAVQELNEFLGYVGLGWLSADEAMLEDSYLEWVHVICDASLSENASQSGVLTWSVGEHGHGE